MKLAPYVLSFALLAPAAHASTRQIGGPLTLSQPTPIATILETPAKFDGQRVQVHGQVTSVCPMKGCWMLISDGKGHEIRIRVEDDGPIVFPKDAPGGPATVEGTVKRTPMTREQYISWHSHLAEEMGQTFDANKVGSGPFERIELEGLAARLEGE